MKIISKIAVSNNREEDMRKYLTIIAVLFISCFTFAGENLIPKVASYNGLKGDFVVNDNLEIVLHNRLSERTLKACERFLDELSKRTTIFFKQDRISLNEINSKSKIIIEYNKKADLNSQYSEEYILLINNQTINIKAEYDIGIIYALETLQQLLKVTEDKYYFNNCAIKDYPRFKWRGLMIDVSRHFMPLEVLKRNIRGMAASKLNTLHLHLSDDQGYRIESDIFPKLNSIASEGKYYKKNELKSLVKYADLFGIKIIPEIDIPGHASAIIAAYPELGSSNEKVNIERDWGIFNPVLDPTKDTTYNFLDKLISEVCEIFPSKYFHIGGDENNGKQWDSSLQIQKFMKNNGLKDNHELQNYFNKRILKILRKSNKIMIGWDEIYQADLPNSAIIHSWRGISSLFSAARRGYKGILSNGYYIDLNYPAYKHYLNDPIPSDSVVTSAIRENILGGEATMWAEFVNEENIDSRIWPRTAAIAEKLWSPQENTLKIDDLYERLEKFSIRLESLGLRHEASRMMMLKRLLNKNSVSNIMDFIDLLEPVKGYKRNALRKHTSLSPLSRVIDIIRPESPVGTKIKLIADEFIETDSIDELYKLKKYITKIKTILSNYDKPKIPAFKEIEVHYYNINSLTNLLDMLVYKIENKIEINDDFLELANKIIKNTCQTTGQVEVSFYESVEKLLNKYKDDNVKN